MRHRALNRLNADVLIGLDTESLPCPVGCLARRDTPLIFSGDPTQSITYPPFENRLSVSYSFVFDDGHLHVCPIDNSSLTCLLFGKEAFFR